MDYFAIAQNQFLKDYSLKEFPKDSIFIKESIPYSKNSMRYLNGTPFLSFVYFGSSLFISSNSVFMDFAFRYAKRCEQEIYRVFDAPNLFCLNNELENYGYTIAHLAQYYLPSDKIQANYDKSLKTLVVHKERLESLYALGFDMALCGSSKGERQDVLAVICEIDGQIVGVAGCTNDSDTMWQIGVDVLPRYQRRGIGTALVIRLKEEIIKRGKCPFYCCAWSNLASKRLAKNAGFVDAWVELSAKPIEEDWIKNIRKN